MEKTNTKKLVSDLTDFVNNYNCDMDAFISEMSTEHRTLQQSVTRHFLKWIEHCASENYRTDLRNEGTAQVCREMITSFAKYKESQLPDHWAGVKPSDFLPFI